jgi:hypothetical protein
MKRWSKKQGGIWAKSTTFLKAQAKHMNQKKGVTHIPPVIQNLIFFFFLLTGFFCLSCRLQTL